jgi:glycerate 2-kinase
MKRDDVMTIFRAALAAVDPYDAVKKHLDLAGTRLTVAGKTFDLLSFDRIIAVGAGKATEPMARAVEEVLGNHISGGLIVVKTGHTGPLRKIRQVEASHPLPDESGMRGTADIIDLMKYADEKTLVLCLLSGGASALLVAPAEGITLKDKQEVTDLLLKAGATIDELNTVRKHLSTVKGGRLARAAYPATIVTLVLSDVIGDRLDVIASGPTVPDRSTFSDAVNVVERYGLRKDTPPRAMHHLDEGAAGSVADTPKEDEPCFRKSAVVIIGNLDRALGAAKRTADMLGYDTQIVASGLRGEAREAARFLATQAQVKEAWMPGSRPRCLLFGGETTVIVKGGGIGGRNQELALAFAKEIDGLEGVTLLSAGTDGSDGPTDAAGAIVDGRTAGRARSFGIDPVHYLNYNDSYTFFQRYDALSGGQSHVMTGPTGTNVMDIQIMLVQNT